VRGPRAAFGIESDRLVPVPLDPSIPFLSLDHWPTLSDDCQLVTGNWPLAAKARVLDSSPRGHRLE
jgi:hypothetical protein